MRRFTQLPTHLLHTISAISFAGALSACTSGQIGGEVGIEQGPKDGAASDSLSGEFFACEEAKRSHLGPKEENDLGVTARELSRLIEGSHEASFIWEPKGGLYGPSETVVTPKAGDSRITITVTPLEDGASYIEQRDATDDSSSQTEEDDIATMGSSCGDYIEIEADVTVQSDNGAFDDTFRTSFRALSGALISTSIELSPGELDGKFDVSVKGVENGEATQTTLDLGFALGTMSGDIQGIVQMQNSEVASAGGISYGTFPADGCEYGYIVAPEGQFAQDLQDHLDQASEMEWSWDEGDTTTLSIDADLEQICLEGAYEMPNSMATASIKATVATDDGRIDGVWDLSAVIDLSTSGQMKSIGVFRNAYLSETYANSEFVRATGINLESDAKVLSFQFDYSIELSEEIPTMGSFAILEAVVSECTSYEQSPDGVPEDKDSSEDNKTSPEDVQDEGNPPSPTESSNSGDAEEAPSTSGDSEGGDDGSSTPGCAGVEFVERDLANFEQK